MMKRIFALLLCLALAAGLLTGCGSGGAATAEPEATAEPTAEPTPEPTAEAAGEDPYAAYYEAYNQALTAIAEAQNSFEPDTVVCRINGRDISWGVFYYFLRDELEYIINYYLGALPEDFNMQLTDEMTVGEYFRQSALQNSKLPVVVEEKFHELGLTLSEEAQAGITEYWDSLIEYYGGGDAYLEAMAADGITEELANAMLYTEAYYNAIVEELYGLRGEKLGDEQVLEWAQEQGFVRTKHILYYTFDENGAPLEDDAKAEMLARAEASFAELSALVGDDEALEARFDELMTADSGDPGLSAFPEGYTFSEDTMYPAFEEAAFALDDYGLSEVVESSSGYHIILRLPLIPDGLTMETNASTGEYLALREACATELANLQRVEWINAAEAEWAEGFETLDLNALLGVTPLEPAEEPAP